MTELVWEGKYRDGKRVAPVRIALPFQTVETVNESAQDRRRTLDLFATGKPTEWRNRLIWGDKKYVLPSLLPEFAGKVDLVYIDPPFDTGADFSFTTEIPDTDEAIEKQPSMIEQKAYRDTWGRGLDSYLEWLAESATLLRDLLADTGSLYLHLDSHVCHYAKAALDEIFGSENFFSQIIWRRYGAHGDAKRYGAVHDTILFYGKTREASFNKQFVPYTEEYAASRFRLIDEKGRRYQEQNLASPKPRPNLTYPYKASNGVTYQPPPNGWKCDPERMKQLDREGRLHFPSDPKGRLRLKMFLSEADGVPLQDVWTDVMLASSSDERVGYPTQKPTRLLERIVKASSSEGALVLDCFCGSGTTAVVAEKLGRRWIACDLGRFAIHTTRKRLLEIPGIKPFIVQNLGKYERQAWMAAEFERPEDRAATEAAYRHFILELFHAQSVEGHSWLHGVKGGRMVHVGPVDAPITLADVKSIARDAWRAAGASKNGGQAAVDILGWEFAFELNETAKEIAAEARVDVRFRRIPREVLEKKAVDQGDVQPRDFFELRALSTKVSKKKRVATVELTDFMLDPSDLPEEISRAVKHWSQWIDYWAIDWDYKDDTFHNEWQSYRSRAEPKLELKTQNEYKQTGTYRVVVKVIDILGNDTTKMLTVEVD